MARVVVDVMLKPEILDPQGKAVQGALPRLGFEGISEVRQGKRFELEVEGDLQLLQAVAVDAEEPHRARGQPAHKGHRDLVPGQGQRDPELHDTSSTAG